MAFHPKKPDFNLSSELEFEEYSPLLQLLKPRLRPDAKVIPQTFGGKTYFVLQDPITLQFYRVAETEQEVLGQLNGQTTLGDIHSRLLQRFGGQAPSFRDLTHFVFMLRHANLLVPEPGEQTRWAVERTTKKRKQLLKQKFSNFMYLTIPLVDPDRILIATLPYVRWGFTKAFFAIWLLIIAAAALAFFYNFTALTTPANNILAPENLFYLWIAFALIKTCHEFGHAFAARHYGAEVHRMGIMFLIFMPCCYVDVTPVWAFTRKWPKIIVGCAGMLTELFIASFALFAWLALEPGVVRTVLYNVIFVASVSTVLFNGNPLLRYDAYYVLADLIEIPNLRQRSADYLLHLVKRNLIGEKIPPLSTPPREKLWFFIYGPLSAVYRLVIVGGILLYIASKLFVVGLIMAAVVAALWLVTPLVKLLKYIFFDKATQPVRGRAIAVFALTVAALVVLVGLVPIDTSVRTPCVVEAHEERTLHAEWPGFLSEVLVKDGDHVARGQLLAVARNEELDFSIRRQEATIEEAAARLRSLETSDLAAAQAEVDHLVGLNKDLDVLLDRRKSLTFRAPFDGQVIAPNLERTQGRFLRLGDALLIVASLDKLDVSAVVDTADIVIIRGLEGKPVRIKFRSSPDRVYLGAIAHVDPSATNIPPPLALTNVAGGSVLLDPGAPEDRRTLLPWYKVSIDLDFSLGRPPVGVTGTARFIVGREPIGTQLWLMFRRMLHRRFLI